MKRLIPVAVFLSVALASLVAARYAYVSADSAARIKFEATADEAQNRIASRIEVHLSLLRSTKGLFEISGGNVPRAAFRTYFEALDVDRDYAGLRGIGFLRLARNAEEVAAAELEIGRQHGVEARIYPDTTLPIRTPIVLYEPLDPANSTAIGYDMYTDADRRAAISATLASDQPEATGLLQLGQNTGGATFPGFLVFQRLDDLDLPSASGAPETSSGGVLYVSYRSGDLFNAALARTPILPVNVEIRDGASETANLVFRSESPPAEDSDYVARREIMLANTTWTAVFRPTSAFTPPTSPAAPWLLGLGGLLLASAMALVVRYQARAYEAVAALQSTTERSLLEKDLMLQEMKHRIKNSIARVLAIARQTASGAANVEEFSGSFSSRLQAMAASQDMLTRSRWQKADVGELLRTELQQVFGNEVPAEMLSGPRVLLDESTTQALGLTFHELATNAMKYGDVARLNVSWTVNRATMPRRLIIVWKERAENVVPPAKTGFGTRLIDMNITRELGGRIARDYAADGLTATIDIPLGRQ